MCASTMFLRSAHAHSATHNETSYVCAGRVYDSCEHTEGGIARHSRRSRNVRDSARLLAFTIWWRQRNPQQAAYFRVAFKLVHVTEYFRVYERFVTHAVVFREKTAYSIQHTWRHGQSTKTLEWFYFFAIVCDVKCKQEFLNH